ncbi:TetR/AcrR family transcriptional regulator [Kibdelosporangium philippinense]|uniref:TetR/AcrR family transcriptional regulator n=1 Tax=Kibdelosporangium philippinense TaxID=211113 RepID=A0ABS8ZAX2_9PSEU|nr:TetR/AcrR family transcriptional regulator [Kibdelosporangium philippinense]MCE7004299.1 TetR/AcrR family transcriptional regulator [Kibdelosporangium philippinense]
MTRRPGRRTADQPAVPDEQEILDQGLHAFAELGYDGTSVRELAKRLNVSHNFINDRYGSKAAFWRAAVHGAFNRIKTDIEAAIAEHGDDDANRLGNMVRAFYRAAGRQPDVNRLMADESNRESDRLDFVHSTYLQPILTALEPTLQRLVKAGRLPDVPMHMLFVALTGPAIALTQAPLTQRLGRPADADIIKDADTLAELVLLGLLRATS